MTSPPGLDLDALGRYLAPLVGDLRGPLTGEVIAGGGDIAAPDGLIAAWQDRNRRGIERAAKLLGELRTAAAVDAAMLSVALRELRSLG